MEQEVKYAINKFEINTSWVYCYKGKENRLHIDWIYGRNKLQLAYYNLILWIRSKLCKK